MHAAFLTERTMSVKIGTTLSDPRPVTGGAVQGSVMGVLDHTIVLNISDSNNDQISSSDSLKMLGYKFDSFPTVQAQLDHLSKKNK